jgi:DNA-binding transcriptional LysR family regulator
MDLWGLKVFLTVAAERSFSRAAAKLYRTQPAVSQAIRRLERELGERLFDRRTGALTTAGRLLQQRGEAVMHLVDETTAAVRELHDPTRRVVTIGANEAAVPALLQIIVAFRRRRKDVEIDVRRTPARHIAEEVLAGTLHFGLLTTHRIAAGLSSVVIAADDLQVLLPPGHALASHQRITMEQFHRDTIIAHNDPSPARDYVLRAFADKGLPLSTMISLPSLDAIKTAVEMGLGIALLPRRCAVSEIEAGTLIARPLTHVSRSGSLRLVCRQRDLSPEAADFLDTAKEIAKTRTTSKTAPSAPRQRGPNQVLRSIALAS